MNIKSIVTQEHEHKMRRLLLVKLTVTFGVIATMILPNGWEFIVLGTNMVWIWIEP